MVLIFDHPFIHFKFSMFMHIHIMLVHTHADQLYHTVLYIMQQNQTTVTLARSSE